MASLSTLSRALSHRNAKIFFGASLTAWTGLWMHRIAVSWFAWELTGSAFWVGVIAFCDLAPAVIVSPLAGAVADRADRLQMTMISQAAIGLNGALIAVLVATGQMTIGVLLVFEVIGGIAASFAQPARQSLMPGLVPPADLPAAVALNSLTFNVARFIGPALAGPIIAVAGVWPAIACNALAYFFATATTPMLVVEAAARRGHAATASLFGEMVDGLRYAARHPGLGPILGFAAVAALLLRGVQEILPPFVERTFGRGAESLAVLTAAFGVGALIAGLAVAARGRLDGTTRLAVLGVGALALATAGFVATGWFVFGVVCAALMGAAGSVHGISVQMLAQSASDPAMRGRVLSLWGLITRACPAMGALILGGLGELFGLRWPTLVAVLLSLLVVAWGLSRLGRIAGALEGPPPDHHNR
ncbi:MFS transporter [Roseomonas terrae]|jgi:MFS family permease|uniref:MFS transporter n=1 Tax=Neoroseomonas terrae TaxID=424799 RepID=A0ABS5EQ14_9PROT|nr:MFS transporter [Neoroseomonas terrae]MBR0653125.1 MFS transporter [Neoroseomonas terrae]